MTRTPLGNRRGRSRSALAREAAKLIRRYPDLTTQQIDHVIAIFPQLAVLDVGLMTADEELAPRLDAFCKDHGRKIRTPISHVLLFLAVPVLFLLITLLAMSGGAA